MITPITSPLVAVSIQPTQREAVARAASPVAHVKFIDACELDSLLERHEAAVGFVVEAQDIVCFSSLV